ncbi:26S proteasome non-ATPase regulatory subunit 8-like protein [Dinothrombium tinctorium]|uniref:26S proteasome non-ATPase regulatory subunit 8 n=1 Tax=Dinothrombium tinctorium TaxID=1965070 RepID=A0A3S3P3B7_9ACAR|nr:26S proteasome non-ATPase regulatory subunit 8-like protein [Dinothrombium tinctorium]
MALFNDVLSTYNLLYKEWNSKPVNVSRCDQLLSKLKVSLTSITFLPTNSANVDKKEFHITRDILEIGAQISVLKKDIPSFERYMAQLKCYYFDYKDELPESAYKYQLLGLNLLCLLAQNRVAEFHTELELLPPQEIRNVYISHPVCLEQWLMEGSYNKVFLAKGNVPAESYTFFMDILLDTIRVEIAACMEKAYEKISVNEAARFLFLSGPKALNDFIAKRNWKVEGKYLKFTQKSVKDEVIQIPAEKLAEKAIEYARELEMIV